MSPRDLDDGLLEPERYELDEPPAYRFDLDRREFIAVLGAGILVSVSGSVGLAQERSGRRGRRGGSRDDTIGDRLHIGTDGVITVLTGKVEVGQGSRTQITMAAAEELGVPVARIRLVMADSLLVPDDGGTAGSRTTPSTVPRVRRACAAARQVLLQGAAEEWNVDPSKLSIENGVIRGPSPGQKVTLGELVGRRFKSGFEEKVAAGVTVTEVSNWKVLGTRVPRVGGEQIVTGAHRYPSDITRPGMLYGAVLRPPSYGATLEAVDLEAARKLDRVVAVRDGEFVGFAAPTSLEARDALEAASATARWKERPEHTSSEELYNHLKKNASPGGSRRGRGRGSRERGSVDEALGSANKVLRESYQVAYVQHAPMEPRAAVAEWSGGSLTVWTGTQNPGRVRGQVAEAFRVSSDKVRVIVPDTGGGFGGKHTGEVAIEAARLARAAGRPVSLRWSREEEFTWAYFRPAGLLELAGGLSASGSIVAWEHANYNSGGSALQTPYTVPNVRTRYHGTDAPLRQGSYRALASTANVFARESFMDELAAAAGADPLEFRLRHLEEGRQRAVLERVAERFGWARRKKATERSRTRGVGLACGTEKGSYVAACAEVELLEERRRFRVVEVCQAFECGAIQNPENVKAQVEGCILQGLGAALHEEIRFRGGRIVNPRFSRYLVPRFRDVPKLETVLVDRPDLPSLGAGETPIIGVAPAVGNALFAAAGVRARSLPLRAERWRSV